jgi:hypothetical protein
MTHSCPLYTSRIECRTSVISGPPPCERGDSTTVAGVECSDPLIHDLSQALEPFRVVAPRRHDSYRLLMVLHALKTSSRMRATTSLIRREWAPIESRPLLVACARRGQHARWAHAHAERPDDDNHHPRNHHRRCLLLVAKGTPASEVRETLAIMLPPLVAVAASAKSKR